MPLPKSTLRLALLGCALTLCVLASQGRLTAATCKDGHTRFVFNGCCTGPDGFILEEQKGQSCLFGTWTDDGNGLSECAGPCFIPTN